MSDPVALQPNLDLQLFLVVEDVTPATVSLRNLHDAGLSVLTGRARPFQRGDNAPCPVLREPNQPVPWSRICR